MIRVIEAFSGIGSQAKALKNINVDFDVVATIDWDINAMIAYDVKFRRKETYRKEKH